MGWSKQPGSASSSPQFRAEERSEGKVWVFFQTPSTSCRKEAGVLRLHGRGHVGVRVDWGRGPREAPQPIAPQRASVPDRS